MLAATETRRPGAHQDDVRRPNALSGGLPLCDPCIKQGRRVSLHAKHRASRCRAHCTCRTHSPTNHSWEALHFVTHAPWAGNEVAHLHPFRLALMKLMKIAELTDWQDLRERFKQWPTLAGMPESVRTSSDGLVRIDLSAYERLCRQPLPLSVTAMLAYSTTYTHLPSSTRSSSRG